MHATSGEPFCIDNAERLRTALRRLGIMLENAVPAEGSKEIE